MAVQKAVGEKVSRGNASQFFVAGELCRRGWYAVVTLGNTPNTDVLVSNAAGTKFVHVQVKTFRPGDRTVAVGKKAETAYGPSFIWVLAGIPERDSDKPFEYFVVPSPALAKRIKADHDRWIATPGKNGQAHQPTDMRIVRLPTRKHGVRSFVEPYRNRWDLIDECLR